jgi:hypothetical protein
MLAGIRQKGIIKEIDCIHMTTSDHIRAPAEVEGGYRAAGLAFTSVRIKIQMTRWI